jgi:hypothetical protein
MTAPLRIATGLLALGVAVGLMHVACVIGIHVPLDPNEGWNAAFADLAMRTGSPYPPTQSYLVNNYPPLSFYLVGALGKVTGDAIVAGRFVALAAFLAVTLGIDAVARRMGCTRTEALFAALLFAAQLMLTTDYVGMDDPQLLGHAVAMGGLLLALREPRTPRDMVFAAALFVLAFFVKHSLVALPVAVAAWLVLAERRLAVTFAVSGVVFLLFGMGVFKSVFGTDLFAQLDSARSFSFANVAQGLAQWLAWSAIPLAGAVALFVIARHEREAMLCVLYASVSVAIGAYFFGGAGVDANAMFDADIALALSMGVLLNRLGAGVLRAGAALLLLVPVAIGVTHLDADWMESDYWWHPMAVERGEAAAEIALIRAAPGPVLCDMLSLCVWAGKPAEIDTFNMQQAFVTGRRSDRPLAEAIAEHHYGLIALETDAPALTQRIRDAVARHYRPVRRDQDRVFYAPR